MIESPFLAVSYRSSITLPHTAFATNSYWSLSKNGSMLKSGLDAMNFFSGKKPPTGNEGWNQPTAQPMYPPAMMPPQQPPKKKSRRGLWIALGIIVVWANLILGVCPGLIII
jgi:hypothetical protein